MQRSGGERRLRGSSWSWWVEIWMMQRSGGERRLRGSSWSWWVENFRTVCGGCVFVERKRNKRRGNFWLWGVLSRLGLLSG